MAQTGDGYSYGFLTVPDNALLSGLGGVNVSLADRDINLFSSNPALAGDSLSGWASAGYRFYVADIGQSSFSYGLSSKTIGAWRFGVRHIGYGTLTGYDPSGAELGQFKSGETALLISKSHQVSNFRAGLNLKGVFSSIAGFRSSALLVDAGVLFIHPRQELTVGLVIRNLGIVLSEYSESSSTRLPFDVQVGTTFKPEYMPVRFSLAVYDLAVDRGTYFTPDGNEEQGTLDKVLRHLNFGTEWLLHRNFTVLLGYNYQVHKSLKLEEAGGGAGVTFGINGRIKTFEFTLSRSSYMVGSAAYTITLAADVSKILMRR